MSSSDEQPSATTNISLTLRMLMSGKEVGPIIGKGGEIINSIREESGAKIYITDGSCPERVITVTGSTDTIFKAYTLICKKMEAGDGSRSRDSSCDRQDNLSLCLLVPAGQCGSLIGKSGSKIKEIREETGASVQVARDPLPGSTERSVTVAGSREAVTKCIYHVCCVMLESPAKGTTVQYQPGRGGFGGGVMMRGEGRGPPNSLAGLMGFGGRGGTTLAAIASIAGSQIRRHNKGEREERDRDRESTYQMSIANELIGSVIGKGGSKIAEIRQMSGAMIRISKSDDPDALPTTERHIKITGNPDSVALAKSLINMSLDLHNATPERRGLNEDERDKNNHRTRNYEQEFRSDRFCDPNHDFGLASLLSKPDVFAAVNLIGSLGGGFGGGMGGFEQMNRGRSSYGDSGRSRDEDRRDSKRSKYSPY